VRGQAPAGTAATPSAASAIFDRLWVQVPEALRTLRWSSKEIPAGLLAGCSWTAERRGKAKGFTLDFGVLPGRIGRELAWCCWRVIESGGKVHVPGMLCLLRWFRAAGATSAESLLEFPADWWCQLLAAGRARHEGDVPSAHTRKIVDGALRRCYQLLELACDGRPWWQREVWSLRLDPRIPRRPDEPYASWTVRFHHLDPAWLRTGLQWYLKVSAETGALSWSTIRARRGGIGVFGEFLVQEDIKDPWLSGDTAQMRVLALEFLGYLRQRSAYAGPNRGQPLSATRVSDILADVEQFYAFMHDNRESAAAALGEPGWLQLGHQHAVLWRRGDKRWQMVQPERPAFIDDTAFSAIMAGAGRLGDPVDEGGLGDEQAMRILMLVARTGRRASEVCMLDYDPLLALPGPRADDGGPGAFVARLRYKQTKIDGAPDTILVDAEIVSIIRAQQQWAGRYFAERGMTGHAPRYLFLAARVNRNGDRHYPSAQLRNRLTELAERLNIRDSAGHLTDFQRTHRFRHTKATTLLNAGVPIHVVQRYLGHLTPTMTMHYAKTLAATAEAEFLRYRKVAADARDLSADPKDLYDMLQLDKRTDRILPNGWCLLPPRQFCDKGNACLTCDKFATDATFLPELRPQRDRTLQLIEERQAAFCARTGAPMSEDNVWMAGRRREVAALDAIIATLDNTSATTAANTTAADTPAAAAGRIVRGAGVPARIDAAIARLNHNDQEDRTRGR